LNDVAKIPHIKHASLDPAASNILETSKPQFGSWFKELGQSLFSAYNYAKLVPLNLKRHTRFPRLDTEQHPNKLQKLPP